MQQFAAKQGKLIIDDNEMRLVAPFNKLVWSVSHEDVERFDRRQNNLFETLFIYLTNGSMYTIDQAKRFNDQVVQFYSQRTGMQTSQIERKVGRKWYEDPSQNVHVETYTSEKELKKEVETAGRYGWVPQTNTAVAGKSNVGRGLAAAALFGGPGLLLAGGHKKDKYTVTFIRQR